MVDDIPPIKDMTTHDNKNNKNDKIISSSKSRKKDMMLRAKKT